MPNGSEITAAVVEALSAVKVANSTDIDGFFQNGKSQHYVKWFNGTLAGKGPWAGVTLVDTPQNDTGFQEFWDRTEDLFGGDASIIQFVCLMSIFANEVRGNFTPQTERMGRQGHPGMAYLFDAIQNLKRSYNTLPGNKTAFECFNDDNYTAAHGDLPLADQLAQSSDQRWSGEVWPSEFDTNPDPAVSGFITEADFMKFRGRGFIQTTGRSNYLPLIAFVQVNAGGNATIDSFKGSWAGKAPDQIAFESTNEDWDRLFQQTDLIVAAEAVRVHNQKSGNYLDLSSDASVLNGTGPGSVFNMGRRVSGSTKYAATFKQRVAAVLAAI
jgi:hypothetical protein